MQEERYNAVLLQVKEDMLCHFYAGWHVMSDKPSPTAISPIPTIGLLHQTIWKFFKSQIQIPHPL